MERDPVSVTLEIQNVEYSPQKHISTWIEHGVSILSLPIKTQHPKC